MDSIGTEFENQQQFNDEPTPQPVEALSVTDKYIGVMTEPAPTFENVAQAGPRTSDWLVPFIALIVIILAGTMIKFSNETFLNDIREKGAKQIDEQVQKGKMTQEQADQAKEQSGGVSTGFIKAISAVSVVIGTPIVLMFFVFVYWLLIKFLAKGNATFAIILSVFGLVVYFGVLDQILSIILGAVTQNPYANFSPAIFMKPDTTSSVYKLMLALSPISIWSYYVMGIGFHKVAGISKAKGLAYSYVPWVVVTLLTVFLGIGGGM
jgi:hypothetical protein